MPDATTIEKGCTAARTTITPPERRIADVNQQTCTDHAVEYCSQHAEDADDLAYCLTMKETKAKFAALKTGAPPSPPPATKPAARTVAQIVNGLAGIDSVRLTGTDISTVSGSDRTALKTLLVQLVAADPGSRDPGALERITSFLTKSTNTGDLESAFAAARNHWGVGGPVAPRRSEDRDPAPAPASGSPLEQLNGIARLPDALYRGLDAFNTLGLLSDFSVLERQLNALATALKIPVPPAVVATLLLLRGSSGGSGGHLVRLSFLNYTLGFPLTSMAVFDDEATGDLEAREFAQEDGGRNSPVKHGIKHLLTLVGVDGRIAHFASVDVLLGGRLTYLLHAKRNEMIFSNDPSDKAEQVMLTDSGEASWTEWGLLFELAVTLVLLDGYLDISFYAGVGPFVREGAGKPLHAGRTGHDTDTGFRTDTDFDITTAMFNQGIDVCGRLQVGPWRPAICVTAQGLETITPDRKEGIDTLITQDNDFFVGVKLKPLDFDITW